MATPRAMIPTAAAHPRPGGRTLEQAVATGTVGALALTIGTIASAASLSAVTWAGAIAAVASPQLLVWLVGVALLAAVMRRGPAIPFAAVSVALAPVATLAVLLLQRGPAVAVDPIFVVAAVWQCLGIGGAALVGAIAGVLVRRSREASRTSEAGEDRAERAAEDTAEDPARESDDQNSPSAPLSDRSSRQLTLAAIALTLLVIGSALALALPAQWLSVYFRIWGDAATATPEQAERYLWTAGTSLACLLAAVVVSARRRQSGLVVLTSLILAAAVLAAVVFQVPQGRFWPDADTSIFQPDAPVEDDDFPVCYGTSGDCPGG